MLKCKHLIPFIGVILMAGCMPPPLGQGNEQLGSIWTATPDTATLTDTHTPIPTETRPLPTNTPEVTPTETPPPVPQGYIAKIDGDQLELIKFSGTQSSTVALDRESPLDYQPYRWPSPVFSPDGRFLAAIRTSITDPMGAKDLVVIDIVTFEIVTIIPNVGTSFIWWPDGSRIIYTTPLTDDGTGMPTGDQGLWLVDVTTGENRLMIPPIVDYPVLTVDISPDGKFLGLHKTQWEGLGPFATLGVDGNSFQVWDGIIGAFDWSPDGRRLVYDQNNYVTAPPSRLFVANLDGSQKAAIVDQEDIAAVRPHWSPDGNTIAFINDLSALPKPSQLWVVNPDGSKLRRLNLPDQTTHSGVTSWDVLGWTPDSAHLFISGIGGLYLVSLDGSSPVFISEAGCVDVQPGSWILDELPTPAPVVSPVPLDLSDPVSIVTALSYDLAHGTMEAFNQVIQQDTVSFGAGIAGSRYQVSREKFLADLAQRIPNGPKCAGYTRNADNTLISIFTTNWQPLWEEPGGATSSEINFILHRSPAGISVTAYFLPSAGILEVIDHQACPFFE